MVPQNPPGESVKRGIKMLSEYPVMKIESHVTSENYPLGRKDGYEWLTLRAIG
jgi:hypothetical protein